jgi:hypothetical protein
MLSELRELRHQDLIQKWAECRQAGVDALIVDQAEFCVGSRNCLGSLGQRLQFALPEL